jgi:hypothetical protein
MTLWTQTFYSTALLPQLTHLQTLIRLHPKDSATNCHKALADDIIIAFYFLLCMGEYTTPSIGTMIHTTPIQGSDVQLWKLWTPLIPNLPKKELLESDTQVAIRISLHCREPLVVSADWCVCKGAK